MNNLIYILQKLPYIFEQFFLNHENRTSAFWSNMLKDMKSDTHLKPGQKGTKRLLELYGEKLLCVRYRYDEKRQVRIKTAEIIVSESPCTPSLRNSDNDIVSIIVPYAMTILRESLKAAGGRWNPDEKLWQVSFGAIRDDIELTERIVSK